MDVIGVNRSSRHLPLLKECRRKGGFISLRVGKLVVGGGWRRQLVGCLAGILHLPGREAWRFLTHLLKGKKTEAKYQWYGQPVLS